MRNLVTACMFCLMCVAHTVCGSHVGSERVPSTGYNQLSLEESGYDPFTKTNDHVRRRLEHRQKRLEQMRRHEPVHDHHEDEHHDHHDDHIVVHHDEHVDSHERVKRHSHAHEAATPHNHYTEMILERFGDGKGINSSRLGDMLKHLGLDGSGRVEPTDDQCADSLDLISHTQPHKHTDHVEDTHTHTLDGDTLQQLCPALLYTKLTDGKCVEKREFYGSDDEVKPRVKNSEDRFKVWLYSTLSIIVISACGLLGVAVVPIMQSPYYNHMLQYLVALAVGTLCGDALLHLLPHAMLGGHNGAQQGTHDEAMWMGLVAMGGVVFFYFTEKGLTVLAEVRKRRQKLSAEKNPRRVRVINEEKNSSSTSVGLGKLLNFNKEKSEKKQCKHKYSEYPYCYDEIAADTKDNHHLAPVANPSAVSIVSSKVSEMEREDVPPTSKDRLLDVAGDKPTLHSNGAGDSYTVILRQHSMSHHGHSHSHGHVHAPPDSISSAAWMLIMGDGLHNFTDGMAIGAAFSANIAGGLSTAVAVLCHELPHELGDFAVLIKAGMSVRRALAYNLLSSVVCVVGMCVGIAAASETDQAARWLFALAAGTFLYIALVDMMPELSSGHSKEGSAWMVVAQALGLATGVSMMLIIAYYEHDLLSLFD